MPEMEVDEALAARLTELREEIRASTGREISEEELIGKIVGDAYESKAEFADSFRE
ncbi:hypothetical protein [Halosimplex amylolyticum]|uniref:hypothetical protein n=1 Tax=Halosimplex amylolyticum TaxID=3396616 RepID=UPI003F554D94